MERGLPGVVERVHLGAVLEQHLHHVVVRLVGRQVERRQQVLVLVVEIGPLPVEHLDDALALGEAGCGRAVEGRVVGVGVLEVDRVGRQGLLRLRNVRLHFGVGN